MSQSLEKVNIDTINVAAIEGTGNIVQAKGINVIGKNPHLNIIVPPIPAKHLPELWAVPCKNYNFIGRSKFLEQIEDHFNKESDSLILTACHGLGGIGKTQVALEFVWKNYKQYKGVVWFDAQSKGQLQINYMKLGRQLNIISDAKNIPMEECVYNVKHWLEDTSCAGWLLIYDNAANYKEIGDLIPTKGGKVLVTSRYAAGWPQVSIPFDVFTIKESRNYIQKILGHLLLESDEAQVDKLAETLGRLPLALAQACAYIKTNKLKISRYLELYGIRKKYLLSDKTLSDETLPPDSNRASVYITWDITMDAVSMESPLAAHCLKICACLASDDIPNFLIEEFANIKENNPSSEIFENALGTLYKYSMLAFNEKSQSASIHRLVQEVIQLKWGREEKENIVIDSFKLLKKCFPYGGKTLKDYDTKRQLFPHLEAFFRWLEIWQQEMSTETMSKKWQQEMSNDKFGTDELKTEIEKNYFVDILLSMTETCFDLGYDDKARELLERILPIKKKHYGANHPEVAITLTNLGNAYEALGNAQKARELLERALPINVKHYGPDHLEVAITLANLGNAYGALGNAQKKRELLERALLINEKHYGPDHLEVAITLANLGNAYGALGNAKLKRELLERALPIMEKHYGHEHPRVAFTLTNLGNVYEALGNAQKARELLERALPIMEKHYGHEHPRVAFTLTNLGIVYGTLGNAQKARDLFERTLPINEKHYGPDHPEVAITLANMGNAYGALGNAQKARELLERALPIMEKHYGHEHPRVAFTLTNLGIVYGTLGNAQKARDLLERTLPINEKHYGPDHREVVITLANLGNAYGALGNPWKARELLERALPIMEKHYGHGHPEVAITLANLGYAYGALGNAQIKTEFLERALPIMEKHYGANHPEFAITLTNLGIAYGALGNAQKKRELLERALPIKKKHFGANHLEVAITLKNLGNAYGALGNAKKKRELLERALAINEKHYGPYHPEVAIVLRNLGIVYRKLGNAHKARVLLERALSINGKHYGPNHPEVAITLMCKTITDISPRNSIDESQIYKTTFFKIIEEFNKINEEIKRNMKYLHVFDNNVILVTSSDTVCCCGDNSYGVLGFGHQNPVEVFTINKELCNKQIVDFKNSLWHTFALNSDGKLYCWGNELCSLNRSRDNNINKPKLIEYLANEKIIDYCCGGWHILVLTVNNEVYAWGANDFGQIGDKIVGEFSSKPFKLQGFNGEKVRAISCGSYHSMALTENGCVYSWGHNNWGQLGINNLKKIELQSKLINIEFKINKIVCGPEHSLLLSREGDIYVFGNNEFRQLGLSTDRVKQLTPIKICHSEKFIEIASHYRYDISIALSKNGLYYVWGECGENNLLSEPKETKFQSFNEIFMNYWKISYKTSDFFQQSMKKLESEQYQVLEKANLVYLQEMDKHFVKLKFSYAKKLHAIHEKSKTLSYNKLKTELFPNLINIKIEEQFNNSIEKVYDQYKR